MGSIKSDIKATYDKISEHFDATRGYMWKECTDFIDNSGKGSVFLDVGCGNGRNSLYAAKKGFKVFASDISSEQLKILRSKAKIKKQNISLIECDATHLPLRPESLDKIMFIAAIHHLPTEKERMKSLVEIRQLLSDDGSALISAWDLNQPRFKDIKTKDGDVIIKWDKRYDRFYHLFVEGELENLCRKADLTIISAFISHSNHYVEVSKRH